MTLLPHQDHLAPVLTLRLIGVRDYSVLEDGQRIGRIRFAEAGALMP